MRIRRFRPLSRRPRRRHAQARGAGASESPRPRRGRALEWVSLFPLPFQAQREPRSESLREKHRGDTDFLERKKTRRRRTMHRPRRSAGRRDRRLRSPGRPLRRLETRRTAPSPSLLPLEKVAGPDPRRAASRRAAFSPPGLPASRAPLPSARIRAGDRGSRAAARAGPSRVSRRSRGSPRLSSAARRSPTSPADRDAAGFAGGSSAPTRTSAARGDSPREGPRAAGVHRGRAPSSARGDARGARLASRTRRTSRRARGGTSLRRADVPRRGKARPPERRARDDPRPPSRAGARGLPGSPPGTSATTPERRASPSPPGTTRSISTSARPPGRTSAMEERQRRKPDKRPHLAARQRLAHALHDVGRKSGHVPQRRKDSFFHTALKRGIHRFKTRSHERCLDRGKLVLDFFEGKISRDLFDLRRRTIQPASKNLQIDSRRLATT